MLQMLPHQIEKTGKTRKKKYLSIQWSFQEQIIFISLHQGRDNMKSTYKKSQTQNIHLILSRCFLQMEKTGFTLTEEAGG